VAIGALAIGRLAVRRATIGSLKVGDLEVARLSIGELRVADRVPGASANGHAMPEGRSDTGESSASSA
jgi:hypothetical protein